MTQARYVCATTRAGIIGGEAGALMGWLCLQSYHFPHTSCLPCIDAYDLFCDQSANWCAWVRAWCRTSATQGSLMQKCLHGLAACDIDNENLI